MTLPEFSSAISPGAFSAADHGLVAASPRLKFARIAGVPGVYGVTALLLITLWAMVLGFSAVQKQRLVDDAQRELAHLDSAVAQHTDGLFRSVELSLRVLDSWLQANPGIDPLRDKRFNALADEIRQASAGLIDPRMVSTRGTLHYLPARDGAALADVHDRPYYREAIKLPPGKLYIGDPVLSRVTGKWGIPVSMRLTQAVGGMQVVFAAVELDRLQSFHERFRSKPSGTVFVMRRDGVVLSRIPLEGKLLGRNLSDQAWYPQTNQSVSGFFTTDGGLTDGVTRLTAYEQLPDFPLMVAVTRGMDDVLANFYYRRNIIVGAIFVISMVGVFFSIRMRRTQLDLKRLHADAQQVAAMLTAANDASPLGQFRTDASGRLVSVNDAWRQIHGLTGDMPIANWQQTLVPGNGAQIVPQGYLPEGVHALQRADGRKVILKVKRAAILVDGAVVGSSGSVDDITEQRANEEAQRMLTEIFELSADIVVQADLQGNFLYCNPAFRRFYEIGLDTPVNAIRAETVAPGWRERRRIEVLPVVMKQGYWHGETVLKDQQGRDRTFSHNLIAHHATDGTVAYTSGILRDITSQKQIEYQLLQSEQRLRMIADSVPALISEIGNDYVYQFANRAYEDWLGQPASEIVGCTVEQVLGAELFKVVGPYHAAAFKGERVDYVRESRFGGQSRWLKITLVPRFGDDGKVNGCYAIGFDISGIRQAEAALRENEQRLRAIADNVPAIITEVGADLRFRFVNRNYSAWLGQTGELVGRRVDEVLSPQVQQLILPKMQAALRGEEVEYERAITEVPGGRVIRFHMVPSRSEGSGATSGFYTLGMDVTAARVAANALRQSEQLLSSITDRMPMRVSFVDKQQRYRFVNRAYEVAFAKPRQTWDGRTVREMLGEVAYSKAEPFVLRALQGETVSFDGELTTAEGYRSYRSDYIPQFEADDHSVIGFVCIITDTTGQKLEERRLIALSQRDPLTGLLNRAGLDARMREALQHANDTQSYMAVMYLDMDRFKQINDSLGHLVGDLLLQGFGGRLAKALRASDTVARLGGDEFVILLEAIDSPRSAARMAQNIVDAMQVPFILEDKSVQITTSVGVAVHRGGVAATAQDLMRRADEQLYAAKASGRNGYKIESDG